MSCIKFLWTLCQTAVNLEATNNTLCVPTVLETGVWGQPRRARARCGQDWLRPRLEDPLPLAPSLASGGLRPPPLITCPLSPVPSRVVHFPFFWSQLSLSPLHGTAVIPFRPRPDNPGSSSHFKSLITSANSHGSGGLAPDTPGGHRSATGLHFLSCEPHWRAGRVVPSAGEALTRSEKCLQKVRPTQLP